MSIREWWASFVPGEKTRHPYRQHAFQKARSVPLWSMSGQSPRASILYPSISLHSFPPLHLSVSTSFFVCRKNEKCWGWALLYFRMTDLLQRGGARRIRVGEEQSVPRAQTRALCKGSHGSASVWQLWKFIAIDFVISSLSIGSTRPLWWIARKLFLQSCFF